MKPNYSTLLALFIILHLPVTAQTLIGKVVNKEGNSIPYATIRFINPESTIAADTKGYFKITKHKQPDTLVISAVGFSDCRITVTDTMYKDSLLTIVLNESREALSEVVVIGYGSQKKREISGSVSVVDSREMVADKALMGKAAGLSLSKYKDYDDRVKSYEVEPSKNLLTTGHLISSDSINLQSGAKQYAIRQLTAGEVNDFNKWKMWEDFSQDDFKLLSEKWQLFSTQRYCVQLQNKLYSAVVDKQVYLVNKATGDTIWRAVTDNTGKAELWVGVNSVQKIEADYIITCKGCEVYNKPIQFADGINKIMVDAPCVASNNVDIAFVVDATGSMGDEIEFLKTELENILDKQSTMFSGLTLNAGAVFYRDKGDDYLTRCSPFDSNLATAYNFIQQQNAGGGGDMPEAVDDALHVALDSLKWSPGARARLLFLVLDAPPHDAARDEMFILMKRAAAKGIRIIPVVCSGADKSTEFMMRNLALTTNGTYVFLTDDSGIGNGHIKPTTDNYTVELLTTLLQRLIRQMVFVNTCQNEVKDTVAFTKIPLNKLEVKVMPNPTQGMITISSNKNVKEMFVTDFTGKILMLVKNTKLNEHINLGDYPNGVYLVKYITTDNEWGAQKVVLMH